MIQELIQKLVDGSTLSFEESAQAMNQIMEGEATPAQFGAFVTSLRLKGETVDEVAGMASVMREKSLRVNTSEYLVDTCGTGGLLIFLPPLHLWLQAQVQMLPSMATELCRVKQGVQMSWKLSVRI